MAAEATQPTTDPEALMARVQELEDALGETADPATLAVADELVAALVALYGDGLRRVMEALAAAGPAGEEVRRALMDDGVVASLLLVHDLYPVDLETRVREALATVRPYMESHGGDVELLGIEDGVARLRLEGSCSGCRASSATLELAIKQALDEHAPDLAGFEAEGAVEDAAPATPRRWASTCRWPATARRAGGGEPGPRRWPREQRGLRAPGDVVPRRSRGRPAWVSVDGVEGSRTGAAPSRSRARRSWWEAWGRAAGLRQRLCGLRRPAGGWPAGGRDPGAAPAAGCASTCPRAGRAAGGEDLQLAPRPAAERRRRHSRGGGAVSDSLAPTPDGRAPPRRPGGRPAPADRAPGRGADGDGSPTEASAASCAAPGSPTTIVTCSSWRSGGSSACARRAGRCARAWPSFARWARGPCGWRTSSSRTTYGRAWASPSAWPSSCAAPPRAAWSPCTPARSGRPRASCRWRRGTS